MWCKPNLSAVAANGNITISGKVSVPNPSYSATLATRETRDNVDLTLNVKTNGGIAIMVIGSADVSLTIPDDGQTRLIISAEGDLANAEQFTIDVQR